MAGEKIYPAVMHKYVESVIYYVCYLQSFVLELLKNSFILWSIHQHACPQCPGVPSRRSQVHG